MVSSLKESDIESRLYNSLCNILDHVSQLYNLTLFCGNLHHQSCMLQWKFIEQLKAHLRAKQCNEKNTSILTISNFFFAVFSHLVYVVTELGFEEKNPL